MTRRKQTPLDRFRASVAARNPEGAQGAMSLGDFEADTVDSPIDADGGLARHALIGLVESDFRSKLSVIEDAYAGCESPIERLMFWALATAAMECGGMVSFGDAPRLAFGNDASTINIKTQHPVGPYVADFVLTDSDLWPGGTSTAAVVECDGHDFHQLTKEQAAHDKARDRYMQAEGLQVYRFTGSEVWRDPIKCAMEAVQAISAEKRRRDKKLMVGGQA